MQVRSPLSTIQLVTIDPVIEGVNNDDAGNVSMISLNTFFFQKYK
jgi:hypothetical protein